MPHVIVKMVSAKSPEQLRCLTDLIVRDVTDVLGVDEALVSVAVEEIAPDAWMDTVYTPDIAGKPATLTKQPGYGPDA
ncbi:4-oxalocrotonate tautomerase [Novosphingobium sp. SG751A]|uniref:tautomerase family protein n=1 Tax=Novosphingobium sp. SG751A TaxID=2587000 RepID=UPI001556A032|nr:tautomerase family protein [Novosphingobium sp. SG751A]NOW45020.1 4-oxalocrotonate tautomerase [Novosphingobium sp. SG751A]